MRAEANIRAGRPADAIADLNVLRTRAAKTGQNNALSAAELTAYAANPLSFLLDERERELAGEEIRWWTLARMGPTVFTARIKAFNPLAAPNVQPHHILRPIPQTQIDRTEGGKDVPAEPGILIHPGRCSGPVRESHYTGTHLQPHERGWRCVVSVHRFPVHREQSGVRERVTAHDADHQPAR